MTNTPCGRQHHCKTGQYNTISLRGTRQRNGAPEPAGDPMRALLARTPRGGCPGPASGARAQGSAGARAKRTPPSPQKSWGVGVGFTCGHLLAALAAPAHGQPRPTTATPGCYNPMQQQAGVSRRVRASPLPTSRNTSRSRDWGGATKRALRLKGSACGILARDLRDRVC